MEIAIITVVLLIIAMRIIDKKSDKKTKLTVKTDPTDSWVEVPRQDQPFDDASIRAEMMATDPEYRRNIKTLEKQDKQLKAAHKAEAEYKETKDADKLVEFWEKAMKQGWMVPGVTWPFKLTDAYYRAGRYDDAWRELNNLVLYPDTRKKARQWQIRILKKEKKDYSHIQDLLNNGL